MNWDDLRVVRAVYQAGSFAAAAGSLHVNETTVARRLSRLEQDLGVTLFEARDGQRMPTAPCEEIVALTEQMTAHADRIAGIAGQDVGVVGRRRIAATDSIAVALLAPNAPSFLTEHPGLALDFLVSTENVNFSRWEADLALRHMKPDRGDFVISKVADLEFYLFEPKRLAADGRDLVCAYPEDLDATPESQFLDNLGLKRRAKLRTKNALVLKALVQAGHCSGVLPGFVCADLLADEAFTIRKLPQARGVWLLVQPHLKNDPATRTVIDWIRDCFAALEAAPKVAG